jgi:hypothetical protein
MISLIKQALHLILFLMLLAVCASSQTPPDAKCESPRPITKDNLISALEIGGRERKTAPTFITLIECNGVDFQLTAPAEQKIRKAGNYLVKDDLNNLVTAVRNNYVSDEALKAEKNILTGCYRRAVFTRMHVEMNQEAMFKSISACREIVQANLLPINPSALRQLTANMLGELESIERQQPLPKDYEQIEQAFKKIDQSKLKIIQGLNELAKHVNLEFTLPKDLTTDFFFTLKEANEAPPHLH